MKLLVPMAYAITTVVVGVGMAKAWGVECAIVFLLYCLVTVTFVGLMQK